MSAKAKKKRRPYKRPPGLDAAGIAEIDGLLKKHRDRQRRGMPADIAFYYERRDSGHTCKQACSDLLCSGIPPNRALRLLAGMHLSGAIEAWDPETTLMFDIARHVQLVTELLAGREGARDAAAWHAVHHWRNARHHVSGEAWPFASGRALLKWLSRYKTDEAP